LADTIRPGCQGNDSSLTLSSRDIALDHPHGGSLHLALNTGDFVQAASSMLICSRLFHRVLVSGPDPTVVSPIGKLKGQEFAFWIKGEEKSSESSGQ
jgi:hypothetical protein